MTRKKPLTIDTANTKLVLKIIPDSPILASQTATWKGIQLGYYQHSAAFETPEHCFLQHLITIHLNHIAVVKEQKLDGCLRCDRFRDGDICLTPATAPVSVRLHNSCKVLHLYLESTTSSVTTGDQIHSSICNTEP